MRHLLIAIAASAALGGVAQAGAVSSAGAPEVEVKSGPEQVDRIRSFGRIDSFRAVDADTLIVWVTPSRPYLIELARRSPDLRFAQTIGLTSSPGGQIYADFDSVRVRGWNYSIRGIYKLSREEAKSWGAQAS